MEKGLVGLLIKVAIGTSIISIYAGATLYFKDNFLFNTNLGNIDIGGKSVEMAEKIIENKGEEYAISLYGKGVNKQKLYGKDFKLNYSLSGQDLEIYQKEQNAFAWPLSIVKENDLEVEEEVSYNEQLLDEAIEKLDYFKESKVIEPVDAKLSFNGEEYEIISEVMGNKLNKEKVKTTIIQALNDNKRVIDLQEENCYEVPKYMADSEDMIAIKNQLNEYMKAGITYLFGEKEEIVSPKQLSEWINGVGEDGTVELDEEKIRAYVESLDDQYSTLGRTREFVDSYGRLSRVSGGDYGYQISVTEETNAIIEALKKGESINRAPIETVNSQGYRENEISGSYVEINLTNQYLWYYKNGTLITQGGVVTGDQSRNRITPQGVYKLDYKQRNATLRGPGYATPVSFWMPFNGGIGIHDATWRGSFGGSIYKYNGSHGCVNVPYSMAQAIFESIDESMPIVCYY